jgi:uncharacterized membrane protein
MTETSHQPHSPSNTPATPPSQSFGIASPRTGSTNSLGIMSLVIAVIALITDSTVFASSSVWPLFGGAILGIVAVAVGWTALNRIKRGQAARSRLPIAGIVIGSVAILGGILAGVLLMMGVALFAWLYVLLEGN